MTTFMMGNEGGIVIAQATALMFWTDDVLVCHRHARGLRLQPFLAQDRKAGFGKRGCPFYTGGELEGEFHLHRSQRRIKQALDQLPGKGE
jgi:hypothetical protein